MHLQEERTECTVLESLKKRKANPSQSSLHLPVPVHSRAKSDSVPGPAFEIAFILGNLVIFAS